MLRGVLFKLRGEFSAARISLLMYMEYKDMEYQMSQIMI